MCNSVKAGGASGAGNGSVIPNPLMNDIRRTADVPIIFLSVYAVLYELAVHAPRVLTHARSAPAGLGSRSA